MFLTDIYSSKESQTCTVERTVKVENHHVVLEEGGVKLSLNVVDTPGDYLPILSAINYTGYLFRVR